MKEFLFYLSFGGIIGQTFIYYIYRAEGSLAVVGVLVLVMFLTRNYKSKSQTK